MIFPRYDLTTYHFNCLIARLNYGRKLKTVEINKTIKSSTKAVESKNQERA